MIVSITGTPGTGKTSATEHLSGFKLIDLTEFVKKHDLGNQENSEFEVNISDMRQKLKQEVDEDQDIIIEGHLSHHFPSDYCVVLRCDPEELEERLNERDYSQEKINENVESEVLDIILTEAVGVQENIIEIDTTGREPQETAQKIRERIGNDETGYGEVDWTERL